MATIRRALALSSLFFLASFSGVASGAENFSDSHETDALPVGWQNIIWSGGDNQTHWGQIYYPSNVSGLGKPIDNVSGPYPLLIWIGDEGESSEQYDWLGKSVASAGYVIVVLPPDWNSDDTVNQCADILSMWYRLEYNNQNGSLDGDPANMRDAFNLEYWGIGGHGLGAKQAGLCQLLLNGVWEPHIANPPPIALIGLGLEDANTDVPDFYLGPSPKPGMGLYLTGTEDDIAKADTNIDRWLDDHTIPWHYMSVTGGNHIQYQDEDTFWERFTDGESTISREEQQSHAIEHIVPYLDLMLKGDHTQWLNATNREINWQTPSDSNAEIQEDLTGVQFMTMAANPSDVNEMEGISGRVVSVNTQLTHRNGALPIGTTVLCTVMEGGDWWDPMDYETYTIDAPGTFINSIENGTSSATDCEVSTEGVPPGNRSLRVDVDWYGMPSYLDIEFFRENREPVFTSPLPVIQVPQHGNASMPYSDFAIDPDGTTLIVEMAPHLPSVNQMHCYLDENTVVCEHTGEAEWTGTETLNLTLTDRYDSDYSVQMNLNATVFAVDDSVVQISEIPSVNLDEDSSQVAVQITSHFVDPEGADATIISASTSGGLDLTWTNDNIAILPQLNWHGSTTVEVWVGDGTSASTAAVFTVNVASIPDPPTLNLTRVSLVEDTPLEVPLAELGWDEDGDSVIFEIEGSHPHISATILSNVLRIVPSADWSGLSTGWALTATSVDGNTTAPIEFEISEVNDPIQLTWGPLKTENETAEFILAIHDPDDGTPWVIQARWDSGTWLEFEADCTASDPGAENPQDWECNVQISMSGLWPGGHELNVKVYEDGAWTEEKIYRHTIPVPATDSNDGGDNTPQISIENGREVFSIWVVFAIVIAAVVAIVGLYMIATLSKDDMEDMLGRAPATVHESDGDDLADLEAELVDFD